MPELDFGDANKEEEDARAQEEHAQLGLAVELGVRGEQPHAVGPGPALRQPQDPERLQQPKYSPSGSSSVLSEGEGAAAPDTRKS